MKNFKIQAKKRFIEAPTILSFNECDLLKWVTWCFVQGPKMDLNLLGEKAKSVRMQRKVLNGGCGCGLCLDGPVGRWLPVIGSDRGSLLATTANCPRFWNTAVCHFLTA